MRAERRRTESVLIQTDGGVQVNDLCVNTIAANVLSEFQLVLIVGVYSFVLGRVVWYI